MSHRHHKKDDSSSSSSHKKKEKIIKKNIKIDGTLTVEKEAKFKSHVEIKDLNVKNVLEANTILATNEAVNNLTVQNILNANEENVNELCFNGLSAIPPTMPGKTCFFTLTGRPNVVFVQGSTGQIFTLQLNPTNPFHGFWLATTKGEIIAFDNVNGVGTTTPNPFTGLNSEDIDSLIFIDTTTTPITIKTFGGDGKVFFEPNRNEMAIDPTYSQLDATTLISTVIANQSNPLSRNLFDTLKLQPDGTLAATSDAGEPLPDGTIGPTRAFDAIMPMLYRKLTSTEVPQILPIDVPLGTDYNLPTNIARYIVERYIYHTTLTNPNFNQDFVGIFQANDILNQFLTTGVTFTSKVVKFRATRNGSGVTDVYTNKFSYTPGGATITISGATGAWTAINGTYVNGVSLHSYGGIPNPSPLHVDVKPDGTSTGSFPNHFYLRFDSSTLPTYTANSGYPTFADGVASSVQFGGPVTISVTHKITDGMEYPAFFAAIMALFYSIFKVSQHQIYGTFQDNLGKFVPNTWANLQAGLTAGTTQIVHPRSRTNNIDPQMFYHNPIIDSDGGVPYSQNLTPQFTYPWTFNDAYGCLPTPGSIFDYDVAANNYLVDLHNLFYTLDGTPTKPVQSLLGQLGYLNTSGTNAGGAYFIGTTAPYDPANPGGNNPDPNVWTMIGADIDGDIRVTANSLYFGFVNPLFTAGKRIAYLNITDDLRIDFLGFMLDVDFIKEGTSPRFGMETYCRVFSEVFKYLNSRGPFDGIWVDNSMGAGGLGALVYCCRSFFGADVPLSDGSYAVWTNDSLQTPQTYSSLGIEFYNNIQALTDQQTAQTYFSQNVNLYGEDSVITGTPIVILTTAVCAASGGDFTPVTFLGPTFSRDLGNNTTVRILGQIDGRLKGGSDLGFVQSFPLYTTGNRLSDANGNPIPSIPQDREDVPFCYVTTLNDRPVSIQDARTAIDKAPTLSGTSGGNPLPNDLESSIYIDFGFMFPNVNPPLPGWTALHGSAQPNPNDHTTWRWQWGEQCILALS